VGPWSGSTTRGRGGGGGSSSRQRSRFTWVRVRVRVRVRDRVRRWLVLRAALEIDLDHAAAVRHGDVRQRARGRDGGRGAHHEHHVALAQLLRESTRAPERGGHAW